MRIAEDGEYLVRILLAGAKPIHTEDCMVFYRTEGTDQISGTASSQQQQAEDLTQYFEEVGNNISELLPKMHPSTRREAALKVYRHNLYCQRNSWLMISEANPLHHLMASYPLGYLRIVDLWDRLLRKVSRVSNLTPMCSGLAVRSPKQSDFVLLRQATFGT
ncbi:MAG: hypothetical protein F6K26_41445 [Moorea sp. SIO2I5]|nr:hypothetical protein [Moorena sp. SIO2I5]